MKQKVTAQKRQTKKIQIANQLGNKNLFLAAGTATIVSLPIGLSVFVSGFMHKLIGVTMMIPVIIILTLLGIGLACIVCVGYYKLGKIRGHKRLRYSAITLLSYSTIANIPLIFALVNKQEISLALNISLVIIQGILLVWLGASIITIPSSDRVMKALGVAYIIDGLVHITIILMILWPIVVVINTILEAIMFFRLARDE